MKPNRLSCAAALLVTSVTLGCDASIPVLPQWTADYAMPLQELKLGLSAFLAGPDTTVQVPPNTQAPTTSPPTLRDISNTVKAVLAKIDELGITNVRLQLEIRKSAAAQFAFADTLVLSTDTLTLANSVHRYGFAMLASDTLKTVTLQLTPATVLLLRALGQTGGKLATQLRGVASTGPGSPVAVKPHDIVNVTGHVILEMPIGGRK